MKNIFKKSILSIGMTAFAVMALVMSTDNLNDSDNVTLENISVLNQANAESTYNCRTFFQHYDCVTVIVNGVPITFKGWRL